MELVPGSEVVVGVVVTSKPIRWFTIQSSDYNRRNNPPFTLEFTDLTKIPGTEHLIEADLAVHLAPEGDKALIRQIPGEFINVRFRLMPTHACGNIESCPVDSEHDSAKFALIWTNIVDKLWVPPLKTRWCGPPELKGYVAGVTSGPFVRDEDWKPFMYLRVNVREMPNARDDSLRRGNHAQQRTPTARRDSTTSSTATDHAVFDTDKVRPLLPPNRSANRGGGTDTTQRFGGAADVAAIQTDVRRLTAESKELGKGHQSLLGQVRRIEAFIDQIEVQLNELKNASRTRGTDRNTEQRLSTLESKLNTMRANIRELMVRERVPFDLKSPPPGLEEFIERRCASFIGRRPMVSRSELTELSQKIVFLERQIDSARANTTGDSDQTKLENSHRTQFQSLEGKVSSVELRQETLRSQLSRLSSSLEERLDSAVLGRDTVLEKLSSMEEAVRSLRGPKGPSSGADLNRKLDAIARQIFDLQNIVMRER